jgi:hypothetical protein
MRCDMSAPHHCMPRCSPPSLTTTTTTSAPWSRLLALLAPPSSHLKRCQQHAGCHPLATLQVHAALMALTAPHKSSLVSAPSSRVQSSYMSLTAASVLEPMGAMAGYWEGYKWAKCRHFWWSQQGAVLSRPVPLPHNDCSECIFPMRDYLYSHSSHSGMSNNTCPNAKAPSTLPSRFQ